MSGPALPVIDRGALLIDRVETVALGTPLARRFAGSAYSALDADGAAILAELGDGPKEQARLRESGAFGAGVPVPYEP